MRSILWLIAATLAAPAYGLDVSVLPVRGAGAPAARAAQGKAVVDALAAVEGLKVYALLDLQAIFGAEAEARYAGPCDEACALSLVRGVRADVAVISEVTEENGTWLVALKALPTSTRAAGRSTVRRELPVAEGARALATALAAGALDLFPELADRSFGTLLLLDLVPGARVTLGGRSLGEAGLEATRLSFRVRTGRHELAVAAPGRQPFTRAVEVVPGQTLEVQVTLEKRRSNAPLVLGAVGGAAGVAALVFGALAAGTAADWMDACPTGQPCAAEYTRARYQEDRSLVDRSRVSANVLWVVSGLAVAAAGAWYLLDPGMEEEAP